MGACNRLVQPPDSCMSWKEKKKKKQITSYYFNQAIFHQFLDRFKSFILFPLTIADEVISKSPFWLAFLIVNNPEGHSEVPVARTLIFILAHLTDPPSSALEFALWTQRPMRSRSQRSREGLRRKPEGKTARIKSTLKLRNWKQGRKGRCYCTVRRLWWMGRAVNIFTEERYWWRSIWHWEAETNAGGVGGRVFLCWSGCLCQLFQNAAPARLLRYLLTEPERPGWPRGQRKARTPWLDGGCIQCHLDTFGKSTLYMPVDDSIKK